MAGKVALMKHSKNHSQPLLRAGPKASKAKSQPAPTEAGALVTGEWWLFCSGFTVVSSAFKMVDIVVYGDYGCFIIVFVFVNGS